MYTNQPGRLTDWLKYESKDGERFSRENWEVAAGVGILLTGMVLAVAAAGADIDVGAGDANTGNGAISAASATPSVVPGEYTVTMTGAGPTAAFSVAGPGGFVQTGAVGTAFSQGGLGFSIADGSSDFVAGDTFTIYVRAESAVGVVVGTGYTAGTRLGIVTEPVDATNVKAKVAVVVRDARIGASKLVLPSGITPTAHAAVIEQLGTQRIYPVLEV